MHDLQRLSPDDAGLLALERRRRLPLHVGLVLVFDGTAPPVAELRARVRERLAALPRYRAVPAAVPLGQGRPLWAADPAFALDRHVHAAALPGAAGEAELAAYTARAVERPLEPTRPLWELHLVESLAGGRFALLLEAHVALLDGGGDLLEAIFDEAPSPDPGGEELPAPAPASPRLIAQAVAERATSPREALNAARALAERAREELRWRDLDLLDRIGAPPRTLLSGRPGAHRRFAHVDAGLRGARRAKERLGGTLNDIVLTAVSGALGAHLRAHGEDTDGLLLRALVPLADPATPGTALASYAPLPVGIADPRRRHAEIGRALDGLRSSGRARAAAEMLEAGGLAPAAALARAARVTVTHHGYNVAIANVPGPQAPRHLLGRELRTIHPALPLAREQTLSVAVVSYAGRLCFGLLGDYDRLGDLDALAGLLRQALKELPKAPARPR